MGSFSLSRSLIETREEAVRELMRGCIVVRCELNYASDVFEYIAISPDFNEIETGMIPTPYQIEKDGDVLRLVPYTE